MNTYAWMCLVVTLGLTGHSIINLRFLREPLITPGSDLATEQVAVLIPARNERERLPALMASLITQQGFSSVAVVVLDDDSTDGTFEWAHEFASAHPNVHVMRGLQPVQAGWLGKTWACHQLSHHELAAKSTTLVFLDADVVLQPTALVSAVSLLRNAHLDIACPYPQQISSTWLQRIVQPLLQWSWATTLPLRLAERSQRASLSAGNGQFLVVDTAAYAGIGGHAAVHRDILEDIALVRAIKAAGGRGGVVNGSAIARCHMYASNADLIAGYTKSLWNAFGSTPAALVVSAFLFTIYSAPPLVAAFAWHSPGLGMMLCASYLVACLGRYAVAARTGSPRADAFLHPISIAVFCWLTIRSLRHRQRRTIMWKERVIP